MLRVRLVVSFSLGLRKQSSSHPFYPFSFSPNHHKYDLSFLLPNSMEELTKHWNCISLSEREGDDICLNNDHCSKGYIIAAKFLTRRALNMDAVARTFKPFWRVETEFTVNNEGEHRTLFIFDNESDVDCILSSE